MSRRYAEGVTPGRDDDALSWDGDDDPTLDVGAASVDEVAGAPEPVTLPPGYTAVGKGNETLASPFVASREPKGETPNVVDAEEAARPPMGSASLIGLGVLAGVYLLLSIGWLLGTSRLQLVAALFLEPAAFQITLWLAVFALPLWFVTVLWLTRSTHAWVRFTLLIAGAVLLIPWPFVLAGAAL